MKEFISHGYLCINNSSSMEIEINDTGEAVRVKDGDKVSRWIMIRYSYDGMPYFMKYGRKWRLNEFMRV